MLAADIYDYIVVGAGSAGAAVAARLSEHAQVLLLEAGPADRNLWTRIPLGMAKLLSQGRLLRRYRTDPEPRLDDRRIDWPRGWTVGGSSAVNGLIWVHGVPHEYDRWPGDGCPGWSHRDLQPWFRRVESFAGGDPRTRGHDGPVTVHEVQPSDPLPDAFLDAAATAGIAPRVKDAVAAGFGGSYIQLSVRAGERCSTRLAYLDPARGRASLTVLAHARATRVELDCGRAVGIHARVGERDADFRARREIVLCGGALGSPQLLELSGIGAAAVLARAGIPVVHALPAVGENLVDHLSVALVYRTRPGASWNRRLGSVAGRALAGARWLVRRDGPLATLTITAQAFAPLAADTPRGDIRLQLQQVSTSTDPASGRIALDDFEGIALAAYPISPCSRGSTHVRSADPAADPSVAANYLADPRDVERTLAGLRMARRLAESRPLADWLVEPCRPREASDDALLAHVRATGTTAFHPAGSCRIGDDRRSSVVDPRLRVHGIRGLRVADASVLPSLATSNTSAVATAIGERAAAMILEE